MRVPRKMKKRFKKEWERSAGEKLIIVRKSIGLSFNEYGKLVFGCIIRPKRVTPKNQIQCSKKK